MEAKGPFETEELSIVVLSETKNANNDVTEERKYGFRRSYFYGSEHNAFVSVNVVSNIFFFFWQQLFFIFEWG